MKRNDTLPGQLTMQGTPVSAHLHVHFAAQGVDCEYATLLTDLRVDYDDGSTTTLVPGAAVILLRSYSGTDHPSLVATVREVVKHLTSTVMHWHKGTGVNVMFDESDGFDVRDAGNDVPF